MVLICRLQGVIVCNWRESELSMGRRLRRRVGEVQAHEPITMSTTSSAETGNTKRERKSLFGSADDAKPRTRTPQEIIATYRKATNATAAAADARNKLVERQEKLEKLSENALELEGRSEDYASLARELVKKMEKRRWWQK